MQVRKREGESSSALIYRFTKRTQQSGILREVKKRRYQRRPVSRIKRRLSAIMRSKKKLQMEQDRKLGLL